MKKFIAVLLCLSMLLSCAFAEALPYARSIAEKDHLYTNFITEETYPELCLTAFYPSMYINYPNTEPIFLCSPFPQGAHPVLFRSYAAQLVDNENGIVYNYGLDDKGSFEVFLKPNEFSNKEIIRDGTDGIAAYIDIDSKTKTDAYGYGMLKIPQFGENAKMQIEVHMYKVNKDLSENERRRMMTTAIEQEIDRIRSEMRFETIRPFMNAGKFGGIKMQDYYSRVLVVFDFFPLKVHKIVSKKDYGIISSDMILTVFDGTKAEGQFPCGDKESAKMTMDLNTSGSITKQYMNNEKNTGVIRMDNGSEWYYSLSNRNEDGSVFAFWAEKKVEGFTPEYNPAYYITFHFAGDGSRLFWDSPEACFDIIKKAESNLRFVDPKDDPYVPQK